MTAATPPTAPRSLTPRYAVVGGVGLAGVLGLLAWGPIPQDQAYHRFADARPWLGVPNAGDVLSNLPFLVVGVWGLWLISRGRAVVVERWETIAWTIAFIGVALTAFGSGWYHLAPDDPSLAWDRLPMTIVFMAFFALVLGERVAPRLGAVALTPLLIGGAGSVALWRLTGDLRAYAIVQFAPLVMIVLLLWLVPGRYDRARDLWIAAGWYAAAKVLEAADDEVFAALGGTLSGHTLKHLAASAAPIWFVLYLRHRRALPPAGTPAT